MAVETTPPELTIGTRGLAGAAPDTCAVPWIGGLRICAVSVTTRDEETGLIGVHVAVQVPSCTGDIPKGGSPSEKLKVTEPLVMGLPQLSTMEASISVGHATGLLKLMPSSVNCGTS